MWTHPKTQHESEVTQSCPPLCNPMDCRLPVSSIHGIFQARILEWVTISFSRSSRTRDWIWVSRIVGRHFTIWATREVIEEANWKMPRLPAKEACYLKVSAWEFYWNALWGQRLPALSLFSSELILLWEAPSLYFPYADLQSTNIS